MIGDLHIHSRHSDGSMAVRDIFIAAREARLGFLSITDHDSVAGTAEALELAREFDIVAIPGIEISAYNFLRASRVHVLGYGYELPAKNIQALCDPILVARDELTRTQVRILADAGYPISVAEVESVARGSPTLYKQHIMATFQAKGVADGIYGELYEKLFKRGGICDREIAYANVFDAVSAIRLDGGIPVLAHPGYFDSWALVDDLVSVGLGGLELYHESHGPREHARVFSFAAKYPSLLLTGGSDAHGSFGSIHEIGSITSPGKAHRQLTLGPEPIVPFAEDLVREAGARLRSVSRASLSVDSKNGDHRDLVTEYDLSTQAYIAIELRSRFPGHSFILEEEDRGNDLGDGPTWILDPIDGTVNFADIGRDYSISLAFYDKGLPVFGLVYDVARDSMWRAIAGKGAWLDGTRLSPLKAKSDIRDAIVDLSLNSIQLLRESFDSKPELLAKSIRGHRALGCASLAICRIAKGELDAYCSAKLSIWDWAAALIALKECGGGAAVACEPESKPSVRGKAFFVAASSRAFLETVFSQLTGDPRFNEKLKHL